MSRLAFVIPCFNQGAFLEATLESVASSTTRNHDVIVVDDGSTARATTQALDRLQPAATHQTLQVIRQPNAGPAAARNRGLDALHDAPYVKFLDADDLLVAGSTDLQLKVHERKRWPIAAGRHKGVVIGRYLELHATHAALVKNPQQDNWPAVVDFEVLAATWERGFSIPIHCALFGRGVFADGRRWVEALEFKEDWLLWLELASDEQIRLSTHDDLVAIYRIHGLNNTWRSAAGNARGWLQAIAYARAHWPAEFTAEHAENANRYYEEFYVPWLWREFGPSFPWRLFQNLEPGRQVGPSH